MGISTQSSSHGGGMYRAFVSETAYKTGSCSAKCALCCGGLQEPLPQDYDKNGVAYVLPPMAEPIYHGHVNGSMGRAAHCGCCGMAVPPYADRARMYPQSQQPNRQTMAMGMPSPACGPPMYSGCGHGPQPLYGAVHHNAASVIQNGWRNSHPQGQGVYLSRRPEGVQ